MRIFFYSIFLFLILFLSPHTAFAHVLKVDGSIGVVLHIDPEDNPVTGQVASFYFEIKDREGKFSSAACACTVTITDGTGQVVHTHELFVTESGSGLSTPLFQFTFTNPGVYKLTLAAKPRTSEAFQPFTLSYDVRVEQGIEQYSESAHHSSNSDLWLYALLGLGVVGALGFIWRGRKPTSVGMVLLAIIAATGLVFYNSASPLIALTHVHRHVETETGHVDSHWSCCDQVPASEPIEYVTPEREVPFLVQLCAYESEYTCSNIIAVVSRGPPLHV